MELMEIITIDSFYNTDKEDVFTVDRSSQCQCQNVPVDQRIFRIKKLLL